MIASIRQALRSLRRSPSFTVTVIATLGIGIGLNAAIFAVVDCVLLRPLGYHDADRIVSIQTHFIDENRSISRIGGNDFVDLAHQVKGLEAVAHYQGGWSDGISLKGEALYLPLAWASPSFTKVMGVQAIAGRVFRPEDSDANDVLVGAAFAREHFGSAQAALGQSITYQGAVRPIVGVLPDGFSLPAKTEVWVEEKPDPETRNRTAYNQRAIGKRRVDVSPGQLAAELSSFSTQLQNAYPEDRLKTIEAVPLQEQIVGKIRPMLHLLMGAVAIILLIVGANVTHLQLVRATQLLRSVTIRTALGASRGVLAGRALLEALLLSAAGCIVALLLAVPALKLLVRIAPDDIPRLTDVHLNLDALLFSFALSALLMAVTAVLPIWRSWHIDPSLALSQDTARGGEGRGAAHLRNGFLVAEVALTLTLSVAAVMLTRQLIRQSKQDLGFSAENLITLDSHAIDNAPMPTPEQIAAETPEQVQAERSNQAKTRLAHLDDTLATISAVPGVESAAAILGAPMGFGGSDVGYAVKGRQVFAPPFKGLPNAELRPVTPNLFSTMHIPLLRGRNLNADDRLGSPMVLLINEELARKIFPGQNPIGQQIMCGYDDQSSWWTIVGVVGDIRDGSPAARPHHVLCPGRAASRRRGRYADRCSHTSGPRNHARYPHQPFQANAPRDRHQGHDHAREHRRDAALRRLPHHALRQLRLRLHPARCSRHVRRYGVLRHATPLRVRPPHRARRQPRHRYSAWSSARPQPTPPSALGSASRCLSPGARARQRHRQAARIRSRGLRHRLASLFSTIATLATAFARTSRRQRRPHDRPSQRINRKERSTRMNSIPLQDLRYTLRQLRRSPGFALTAVITLALGIGAPRRCTPSSQHPARSPALSARGGASRHRLPAARREPSLRSNRRDL
jgi:putative ABC transport system permease protein